MYHDFSYPAVLDAGSRFAWRIEDVLPAGATLDFTRPLLPEALAQVREVPGLDASDQLTLNHIRGHEYLAMFGLIEEFILPFLLDHIRSDLAAEEQDGRMRALLQFASEEAKHIELFRRFETVFAAGFGKPCGVIGPAEAIAAEVLRHDPLSVALLILQVEWMTQSHYLDSVRDDTGIDPLFASLLKHHWIEEAQHAKLDTLIVEAMAARRSAAEIEAAVAGYLEICAFFDAGFQGQTQLNLAALENAIGRTLPDATREAFLSRQHQALRRVYLVGGMTHPRFAETLEVIAPTARAQIGAVAASFS